MLRSLQPELLDSLPPDHPDARHSRRDLRLLNTLMGNFRWFARTLPPLLQPDDRVLELGAGAGGLGFALAGKIPRLDAIDFAPRPARWPAAWDWNQADLLTFPRYADYTVVIANLILHHFTEDELRALGEKLRRSARLILACEPLRQRRSQRLLRCLAPLMRANPVTRHDGHVSIAAGFSANELPDLLGLTPGAWDCRCAARPLGACRMIARRR